MRTKATLFFVKLLIIFSVFLIGIGTGLIFFGGENIFHPIIVKDINNENIYVTTVDDDEDKDLVNMNAFTVIEHDIDFKNNNYSLSDVSNMLRKKIEKHYGISIKYANETAGYNVGGMSTVFISNPVTCHNALIALNSALALYPNGFFQEIKSKGYSLTFYLVKSYSTNNVTGVTDSSSKNIIISISTDYDFIDTLHHEIYHSIEKVITISGGNFSSWDNFNPSGFKYGLIDSSYSYAREFSSDAFFVNSYAMTDQGEDRASTFEYMMKTNKASCLNYGKTVWLKAVALCEQIDSFFTTVTPNVTEYWERHIY